MTKILVADPISQVGVERLKACDGFEVLEAYGSSHEQILELVSDALAMIVRSETAVDAEVIDAAKQLRVIGRAGRCSRGRAACLTRASSPQNINFKKL